MTHQQIKQMIRKSNMQFLGLFIAELLVVTVIASTSVKSMPALQVRHSIKQVLGMSYIAQEDTENQSNTNQDTNSQNSSSDQQPTDDAVPTPTPLPQNDNPVQNVQPTLETDTPTPTPLPVTTSDTTQQLQKDETSILTVNTPTPTEIPSAQITPTPSIELTPVPTPSQEIDNTLNNNAVNGNTVISSAEHVNEQALQTAQKENIDIAQIQNPSEQTTKILSVAKEKIMDMNQTITHGDFATTSFLTQRLTNQISSAKVNIQKVSSDQQHIVQQRIQSFCKQADLGLQTQQLVVPEALEQDIEVVRGLCISTQ